MGVPSSAPPAPQSSPADCESGEPWLASAAGDGAGGRRRRRCGAVRAALAVVAAFAAVSALSALQENKIKTFRNWLIATMGLGVLFLGIEMLEWIELFGHGVTHQTLFGSAFFTLTGFHGLHVIIGLVWMIFLLVRTLRNTMSAKDSMGLEVFGLYWHFVDIVWIILFTIVYLI